jgi:hypothetical protein
MTALNPLQVHRAASAGSTKASRYHGQGLTTRRVSKHAQVIKIEMVAVDKSRAIYAPWGFGWRSSTHHQSPQPFRHRPFSLSSFNLLSAHTFYLHSQRLIARFDPAAVLSAGTGAGECVISRHSSRPLQRDRLLSPSLPIPIPPTTTGHSRLPVSGRSPCFKRST